MNEQNNYDEINFENEIELATKKKTQRKTFSRVFAALFAYLAIFQFLGISVYVIAAFVLSEEQYLALQSNTIVTILISSGVQYLIAFPIFLLITRGMRVSENKEKSKLSIGEFIVFFAISELFMFVGNLVGVFLNFVIGNVIGKIPENGIDTLVQNTPAWIIILLVVIIGPIVEELVFRKVMIDRLSVYGDRTAIVFSAIAFGLMHGNFYQLFYSLIIGFLLGYVYTKTRDVKYTIALHIIINFMGSVVVMPIQEALDKVLAIAEAMENGGTINLFEFFGNYLLAMAYNTVMYGLIISGAISLIYLLYKRRIKISDEKDVHLPNRDVFKGGLVNVGAILFVILSGAIMLLNLL